MENLEGKFSYFQASAALAYHPNMNLKALRLFDRIEFLSNNQKGYCWAHNDDLAYFSAQSEQLIDKNLKLLEDLGFIKRESVKEVYLNRMNKKKFKTVRRIFVTVDKNIVPDYVPSIEYRSTIDYNELINPPIQNRGVVDIQNRGVINNNYTNNTSIPKGIQTIKPAVLSSVDNDSSLENTSKFKRKKKPSRKRDTSKREPRISGPIKKDTPKKVFKPHPLVEYWNNISWTRVHKDPQSKTYQNAAKLINQLKYGTFFKGKKFDQPWLKYNKGVSSLLTKKWTNKEIKTAIDNVALYLKEGYEPLNKDAFPKSLEQLLYNPYSMKSQFLKAFLTPARLLSETTANPLEIDQDATDQFLAILYGGGTGINHKSMPKRDYKQLVTGVNDVIEYYEWLKTNVLDQYDYFRNTLREKEYFIKDYQHYLMYERYSSIEIKPHMIGPNSPSKNWDGFLTYLAQCYWDGNCKDGAMFIKS